VFVAYVLCFLVMKEGVSTSGKAVYFTALFPYVVLIILLVKAATLEGFGTGIKFYLTPKLEELGNFEVWYQALSQIFFSLGIGFGGLMTLSRYCN
jgi:SNF family Na+-dependent transporter